MAQKSVLDRLGEKGADIDVLADRVLKNSGQIPLIVEALQVEQSSKKYAFEKVLRRISEKRPESIYPYFDVFAGLLDSDNSFLKWGAIITISNLASVDTEGKFDALFAGYYSPVAGPVMITAANIIGSSARIMRAKPQLADAIVREILKVRNARYFLKGKLSPECRNVAIGHAIDTFDQVFDALRMKTEAMEFVKAQSGNTRKQVAQKAERFVRKHSRPEAHGNDRADDGRTK
jgi:hypothetical protein